MNHLARIQSRTRRNADCLVWTGALNSKGYGCIAIDGRSQLVHRVAYEAEVGPIPEGLVIDHLCRNRACVNTGHMEPVTIAENSLRGDQQNRDACKNGHRLTYRSRGTKRVRCCRVCEAEARSMAGAA